MFIETSVDGPYRPTYRCFNRRIFQYWCKQRLDKLKVVAVVVLCINKIFPGSLLQDEPEVVNNPDIGFLNGGFYPGVYRPISFKNLTYSWILGRVVGDDDFEVLIGLAPDILDGTFDFARAIICRQPNRYQWLSHRNTTGYIPLSLSSGQSVGIAGNTQAMPHTSGLFVGGTLVIYRSV